jgi:hypothetical protein
MKADRPLLTDGGAGEGSHGRGGLAADGGYELSQSRREPTGLGARAADPYAVWLAQREAERERDEPTRIRWVYRHPRVTRAAAATIDVTLGEREASDGDGGFAVLA